MVTSVPALVVGAALMVSNKVSMDVPQPFVAVYINNADPAVASAAEGV